MEPDNLRFGGAVPDANPIYIVVALLAGILLLFLRRDKAIYPFIIVSMVIPFGQAITIAGVHFQMLRLISMFGMVRVFWALVRKEIGFGPLHPIDKAFALLSVIGFLASNLL